MEDIKFRENWRRTKLKAEEIQLFKDAFVIVPYQVSGFIDYTNRGASSVNIKPEDFETFKRVWTGNDACALNWKGSLELIQDSETLEMKYKYQLGEVFLGTMETNDSQNVLQQDKSFSEYTSQEVKKIIQFRVDKQFEINDYYQFMFYKIPEFSGSTLYRISNIERDYVGNQLLGYVITFETINQDLANTGRARQQNINPNSPGQGYIECIVKDKNWPNEIGIEEFEKMVEGVDYYKLYDRYITYNFDKIKHNPVKKVIVKKLGNGILNSFAMIGRPIKLGDTIEKYREQRILFPFELSEPTTPTLFHSQNNNNNFYFGEFSPTLEYFKDLMAVIKDSFTPINKWNYQGWLTYDYKKISSTNPKENGNFKYNLYGTINQQENEYKKQSWEVNTETKIIDTTGNYGVASTYVVGGVKKIHDHLFDNFWTTKQVKSLPLEKTNTLSFGLTLASSLGLAFTNIYLGLIAFSIGTIGTFASKIKPKPLQTFRGLINASFLDYNNNLFGQTDSLGNKIPFNLFDNDKDSPSSIFYDSSTLQTSFEAKITDKFLSQRVGVKEMNTLNIGQKTFEDGTNILPSGIEFELNGDATLLESDDFYEGYIIDGFKFCSVGKVEISVEFLDSNNDIVWSGIYQSEGKWTNSLREIWTEKNCSVFGRENIFYTQPVPYPKPLPEPPTNIITGKTFTIPINLCREKSFVIQGGGIDKNEINNRADNPNIKNYDDFKFGINKKLIIFNGIDKKQILSNYQSIEVNFYNAEKWIINLNELFTNGEIVYSKNRIVGAITKHFGTIVSVPPAFFPTNQFTTRYEDNFNVNNLKIVWDEDNKQMFLSIDSFSFSPPSSIHDLWYSPNWKYYIFFREIKVGTKSGLFYLTVKQK